MNGNQRGIHAARKRIILAITGASGAILGIRALELLKEMDIETHLVISSGGKKNLTNEANKAVNEIYALASFHYENTDLEAPIASGSFVTEAMLVVPCSIKTLSAVANSYSKTLIIRAADVCLKEGRPLLLAVRETPFHAGHIRLMQLAARAGAVLFPPIPSFYGRPTSLDDIITDLVSRMLLRVGIDNNGYTRWTGK